MGGKYQNENDLLIPKIEDKIQYSKTKNKIQYTDFLNLNEKNEIEKYLKMNKISNYFFFGGNENSERGIFIFFPDKLNDNFVKNNLSKIIDVIKIKTPKEEIYEHRIFLSALMKLGIKREKIGDIVVVSDGAEIVTFCEISDYIINGLKQLTRFKKSKIEKISINELKNKEIKYENISIIVASNRLDGIVSELAKCSRKKADEYIKLGKVFINSIQEFKESKKVLNNDIITIRGKGKYIYQGIEKETSKSKLLLNFKKYK